LLSIGSQKAQITRYRERWQKLKENAKKKQKSAKEGYSGTSITTSKIPEEDEGARSDA
jgi:hypothetical protein